MGAAFSLCKKVLNLFLLCYDIQVKDILLHKDIFGRQKEAGDNHDKTRVGKMH